MIPYQITDNDSLDLAFAGTVKAGFPSPAEEVREKLDLVKLLVQHSASTFFLISLRRFFAVAAPSMMIALMVFPPLIILV